MNNSSYSQFYNRLHNKTVDRSPSWLDKIYLLFKNLELHRTDAVANLLPEGEKILDVGCGNGELLLQAYQLGYRELCGIEVSDHALKQVRSRIEEIDDENLKSCFLKQNIDSHTDFKSKYFDTITIVAVLEHVYDLRAALSEVYRLLKPGGRFILEVPNLAFLPRRISLLFGNLPRTGYMATDYQIGHLHAFTFESIEKLLSEHGFRIKHLTHSGILWKIRQLWPSLLSSNIIVSTGK